MQKVGWDGFARGCCACPCGFKTIGFRQIWGEVVRKKILIVLASAGCLAACNNAAEEAVRETLIDGESARFRDVQTCTGDRSVTTGEVNGKNRMGAYTGFEPFFYADGRVTYAADADFIAVMERCYGTGEAMADAEATADAMEDAASDPAGNTAGGWFVDTDTDPLDDSKQIIASLSSESGRSRFDGPIRFVMRCQSNKTEVYAIWHDYVGDDSRSVYNEYKNVEVRVGQETARTERWGVSTDKQATFAPDAIGLLRKMNGANRLVLRTTPYNENPITAVFDLRGFATAAKPIARECGWKLGG